MPKIFITGSGGVGKSTIINRLAERGFTAYDTDDMPGVTRLEDTSGQPVKWPDGYVDWHKYRWNWQRPELDRLLASDGTVFIGAIPGNWREFKDEFDKIIVLSIDSKTHEQRLKTRNVHTHGQGEKNIVEQVYSQQKHLERFLAAGAIEVINDHSIDEVVDEILDISHVDK